METVKIQHFGQRNHQDTGSFTIATTVTDNVVTYGVAFCSTKDKFVKKVGAELATKRVEAFIDTGVYNMAGMAIVPPITTRTEVLFAVLAAIVAGNQMPDWARPLIIDELIDYSFKANDRYFIERQNRRSKFFKK